MQEYFVYAYYTSMCYMFVWISLQLEGLILEFNEWN